MGSWEGWGGMRGWGWSVCVYVCVCVCVCVVVGRGGLQSQASAKPLPQSADMGNEKGGGCYFFFFFFFVTIPIQQWPTTETWEGQTNRLTHRRTHTPTHTDCTQKYILSNNHERTGNQLLYICRTDEWAHRWPLLKHTACRLKWQHWEWGENRMATTIETAWGAQRNTPATADCWHMNTQRWAC